MHPTRGAVSVPGGRGRLQPLERERRGSRLGGHEARGPFEGARVGRRGVRRAARVRVLDVVAHSLEAPLSNGVKGGDFGEVLAVGGDGGGGLESMVLPMRMMSSSVTASTRSVISWRVWRLPKVANWRPMSSKRTRRLLSLIHI